MRMKPLVGVTANPNREWVAGEADERDWMWISSDYFHAVERAGGIPMLMPFCKTEEDADALLERVDCVLLSGGRDLDPQLYGEQPHQKTGKIHPERDHSELLLAKAALSRGIPVLGICRGHQVVAVAGGGTLWQDLPSQLPTCIKHKQDAPRWYPSHAVTAVPGTRVASLLGTEFKVNTYHHQAVKDLPLGWIECAVAPDGVNEAMEMPGDVFRVTVQWHPECFQGRSYSFAPLFEAFVAAGRQYRSARSASV